MMLRCYHFTIYIVTMLWFWKEKDKIQKNQPNNLYNTETMLPVSELRWNTMILKDGWLRAVMKVTGLNIDLKNYDEQVQVIEQYKRFLNGLDFPIQILIRNDYLELSDYIWYMKGNVQLVANEQLKAQWEWYISFLENINSQQGLIYTKEFYVVLPFYPFEQDTESVRKPRWQKFLNALSQTETPESIVGRYRNFVKYNKLLTTRVWVVSEWLRWVGLIAERLDLSDTISLLFKFYNPDAHKDLSTL